MEFFRPPMLTVVGDGQVGKERVTVLPLNVKLPCGAMSMMCKIVGAGFGEGVRSPVDLL
jgi:hypothetical protein